MAELLAADQHGRVAERRLQPGDRALDPDRVVKIPAVRRGGEAGPDCEPIGEAAERAAAAAQVAAGVDGDSAQPGREFGLAAKAADLVDEDAADVLGDVVGVGPRAGQLPRQTVDSVVVKPKQLGEAESDALQIEGRSDVPA